MWIKPAKEHTSKSKKLKQSQMDWIMDISDWQSLIKSQVQATEDDDVKTLEACIVQLSKQEASHIMPLA
jgi:uncharacterized membrane protein YheB (UPF0754 family)